MKNTIIVIIVVLVVGLGIYYIASRGSNNSPTSAPTSETGTSMPPMQPAPTTAMPPSAPVTAPSSSSVAIAIQNFAFTPATATIKSGTKVTWTNDDSVAHTVTSDSGNLLNSGPLAPGQSFSFTFTSPGTITYHCSIHPMMKGTIVVE